MRRRDFLRGMLASGAFPLLPGCLAPRTYRANEKVRLAAIGVGCQAWYDIGQFLRHPDLCEFVALCDTDMGAPQTAEALKRFPSLPRYRDFRKLFDAEANRIDAVLVATPDHSHFAACMHAMRLGKAVYVEKPLANTFRECDLLRDEARRSGVVTQMGNQGHSLANYWQFKHYWENGLVRDVTRVVAHMNNERRWHKWGGRVFGFPKRQEIPATLDWNAWLSVAPHHDYCKDFVGGEWRNWFDFGDGCMGDWGAHIIDCVHQFVLGGDLPTRVDIAHVTGWNRWVFPIDNTLSFAFPKNARHGDVTLEWYEGVKNQPKVPKGFLYKTNAGLFPASAANDGMVEPKLVPGKEIYQADGTVWQGMSHGATLMRIGTPLQDLPGFDDPHVDHYANFLRAVRGEDVANSPFEVAAPLSQIFCLGCIAQRLNRGFAFDPVAHRIVGDDEANRLLQGPAPRQGWEHYFKV